MNEQAHIPDETVTTAELAVSIADELRAHPEHWFKGDMVGFPDGSTGSTTHEARNPTASCWCLIGLIAKRITDSTLQHRFEFARYANAIEHGDSKLHLWNDRPERTVEDVIDLCDRVSIGYGFAKFRAAALTGGALGKEPA